MKNILLKRFLLILISVSALLLFSCDTDDLSRSVYEPDLSGTIGSLDVSVETVFGYGDCAHILIKAKIPEDVSMEGIISSVSVDGNFKQGGFIYDLVDVNEQDRTQTYLVSVFDSESDSILGKTVRLELNTYRSTVNVMEKLASGACEWKFKLRFRDMSVVYDEGYSLQDATIKWVGVMPSAMELQLMSKEGNFDTVDSVKEVSVIMKDGSQVEISDVLVSRAAQRIYLMFQTFIDPENVVGICVNGETIDLS